ncbi:MAG: DEAD/DEAH box helicase, partial [Eudoraea sp.]|nr:DEAD/DEAH box helicase [Eudoraea sp.]
MKTFNEMGFHDPILKAIGEIGFQKTTPIQEKAIPWILNSPRDIIALAQTGTGKTAAYGLPIIQKTAVPDRHVQGLILSPTRELCMQITNDLQSFSRYTESLKVVPVYGGAPIDKQIQALKNGAHLVVGTPGRVKDMIERGLLKLQDIRWLVLDEADEMLQMGFKEELDAILGSAPAEKQTLLFSATMPKEVHRIALQYMTDPIELSAGTVNASAENVDHIYYMTHARNRYEVLKRIADMHPDIYGIVFCRTRRETKEVADKFMSDGYNADALHGDLSQAQRDYVMNRFRKRQIQMLVATDVAARGLDVNDLTHVINYNLPDEQEAYIHRSGRTGRAGKKGISISIIHSRETGRIMNLEKLSKKKFKRVMIPEGKEICKKQLFSMISKMEKVEVQDEQISEFLPEIFKKLDWMSKEDLIRNFVSVEFNRFLNYYKDAPDLNVLPEDSGNQTTHKENQKAGKEKRRKPKEYSRFYINLGSKNNINPTKLIGLLLDTTNDRSIEIGKIDIMKGFSFFEVEKSQEQLILRSFNKNVRRNRQLIKVELSNEPRGDRQKRNPQDHYEIWKQTSD